MTRTARRNANDFEDRREITAAIDAAQQRAVSRPNFGKSFLFDQPSGKHPGGLCRKPAGHRLLRDAIANHPLNQIANSGDEPRNKIEELQRLAVNVEAQLRLDMEDEVLGHMAKLLSLDAMAFAEEVAELAYLAAGQVPETADFRSPAAGVKLFVNF